HGFPVYPNLAGDLQLTSVNQLWIADITYIRLESEFVYLAVVLDAFSRRVIGWALDRTLEAKLTITALEMALSRRKVQVGLVHHSDRGVQYAADEYTGLLTQLGIQFSMSRKGNPYDNARTESFMKTLKYEEVYRQEYRDLPDALRSLRRFIEKVYNEKRLHSALGYLPPSEFETNLSRTNNGKEAASRQLSVWSFFRHREIIRSDVIRSVRERRNRRSPAHRLDEFPVGYSSASCTPALRASASPTGIHSATQARRRQRSFQPTANCVLTFCATPGDNRRFVTCD